MYALAVKAPPRGQYAGTLPGGNKQKVSFGKWIAANPLLMVMGCPTRGGGRDGHKLSRQALQGRQNRLGVQYIHEAAQPWYAGAI